MNQKTMTTIIDRRTTEDGASSAVGIIIGVIVALVLIVLFFVYALPAIQGNQGNAYQPASPGGNATVNVQLPSNSASPNPSTSASPSPTVSVKAGY